ncbi:treslin-like [Ornithodoros turicata]|uniref:treslin-like n=1 Tax=Ornithodoros turicata TaxID=34597 RepID=UPI0031397D92
MPRAVQTVFLIDIASFHGYDDNLLHPDFEQSVNCIRYSCLKFLTYFGTRNTRWGCKYYCSNGNVRQKMEKRPFSEFNLESFEEFEDELLHRFNRYNAACSAFDRTTIDQTPVKDAPCNIIRVALTQLASEYTWDAPDIASPVKRNPAKRRKLSDGEDDDAVLNCVFHISRIPYSHEELDIFLGKPHKGADIAKELMPPQLQRLLISSLNTRFIWIDCNPSVPSELEEFGAAITKLNGKVLPLQILMKSCGTKKDDCNVFFCEPLSSVAELYLHEEPLPPSSGQARFVLGDEQVCRVVCCFDSVLYTASPEGLVCKSALRVKGSWKEIKVLYRTSSAVKQSALNGEQVLGYRLDPNSSSDSARSLSAVLRDLTLRSDAFAVELSSDVHHVCHGFLFPVNATAFCVHVVTVLSSLPLHLLRETSFEAPSCYAFSESPECLTNPPNTSSREVPETTLKAFDARVLEKWYIPPAPMSDFLSSVCKEDSLDEKRERLLEKLRDEYTAKYSSGKSKAKKDERPKSDQVAVTSSTRSLRKRLSASLNVSSRSADMVAHSYISTRKEARTTVTVPPNGTESSQQRPPSLLDLSSNADEGHLIEHLKSSLEAALNSASQTSLLTCVQNVVSVVKHHADSRHCAGPNSAKFALKLLETHFVVSCAQIAQKYSCLRDCVSKQRRLREYQFQVLLALEKELHFRLSTSDCVETVVSLLRTVSFIYSPSEANQFLWGSIKESYLMSLRDILLEISEELNVPLFSDTLSSVHTERDFSDFGSLPSISSVPSQDSYLSSIPSMSSQKLAEKGENRPLPRVDLSQPSVHPKRQIVIPRASKKVHSELPRSSRTSKREPGQVESAQTVRRGLFVSPTKKQAQQSSRPATPKRQQRVLKTTFVPETPTHKQGGQVVLRRQARMRKRSGVEVTVRVIRETPQKLLREETSTTPRKSLSNVSETRPRSGSGVAGRWKTPPKMKTPTKSAGRDIHKAHGRLSLRALLASPGDIGNLQCQQRVLDSKRTPTKSSDVVGGASAPTRSILKNKFTPSKANLLSGVTWASSSEVLADATHVTPRKSAQRGRTLGTPPQWTGSESLFSTPESVCAGSESSPKKLVAFSDLASAEGYPAAVSDVPPTTPRRRISKRLLHSPATPKFKYSTSSSLSKSESSFLCDTSRQLFGVPSKDPTASESSPGAIERTRKRIEARVLELPTGDSANHFSQPASGDASLCETPRKTRTRNGHPRRRKVVLSQSAEHEDCIANDVYSETHDKDPQGTSCEPVHPEPRGSGTMLRITRSRARETGLTPHEIFVLSQSSPRKEDKSGTKTAVLGARGELAKTPQHVKPQKRTFTPPSAISVLHLTSSPMLLKGCVK